MPASCYHRWPSGGFFPLALPFFVLLLVSWSSTSAVASCLTPGWHSKYEEENEKSLVIPEEYGWHFFLDGHAVPS